MDPLTQRLPADTSLGGDVGNGAAVQDDSLHEASSALGSEWGVRVGGDGISVGKSIVKCLHICYAQCMTMNAKAQCTCMDPAVACPACLASRDANGWPKSWRERMRTSLCPACGKSGVTVGLDCTLLETSPTVRPHACGVGGPGSGQ